MNEQHIARLETQIERLVEGAFGQLFGKKIRAQDIAVQLARAMEDNAVPGGRMDARLCAPDYYIIYLNSTVMSHVLQRQPALAQHLSDHLVELASSAGYRLNHEPQIDILPDDQLGMNALVVDARHVHKKHSTTAVMKRVEMPPPQEAPRNPQLLLQGQIAVPLNREYVNIGRSRDNHIVIDDPSVSRQHLQLRLRFGHYVLFDTQSYSGTTVNDVQVKEHILQTGDVICIGRTRLVYIEDSAAGDTQTNHQDPVEPGE